MKRYTLISMMFFLISDVHAADVESTTIKRLMLDINYGEMVYIELEQRQATPIACHTNSGWEYVLDTSTPLGNKMYSMLLAAYAAKSPVKFVGMNNCSLLPHTSTEGLRRIELK